MLKAVYNRWDEWNFRHITPTREQRIRRRWSQISRLGLPAFALLAGLVLSALFVLEEELIFYLCRMPHRAMPLKELLAEFGPLLLLGFVLAPMYYLAARAWVAKMDAWRTAGRL
jgi:hypothetical protein